jgi:outer membrane protein OmpA-like peptidoglycan-associated protein
MEDGFVILGQFNGLFKTLQGNPLGQTDHFPKDFTHNVRIYKGEITDTTFKSSYQPEEYQTLKSFQFLAVPNIEVNGNSSGPFDGKRVCTFTQLVLVEPKIDKVYAINNQTYGEISGLVYGITGKNSQIDKINPDPVSPSNNEKQSQFGSNELKFDTDFNRSIDRFREGCLPSLLRLIGYLFLFLFLWWLIKACNDVSKDEGDCDRRDRNKLLLEHDIKIRDSLQKVFDKNLPRALANIKNIYFYNEDDEIHEYSLGSKGSLERLMVLLKVYNEHDFYVIGHVDSDEINQYNEVDWAQKRVKTIKDVFIENGVDGNRLFDSIAGDKKANKSLPKFKFLFSDYSFKEYNSNMRVEIKIKK